MIVKANLQLILHIENQSVKQSSGMLALENDMEI